MVFTSDGSEKFRMVALWNQGQTLTQIAATFGCSASLVDATIKSLAVEGCYTPVVTAGL